MRVFKLILLGALAYVVSVLFLFPAAPVIKRVEPNIKPIELSGVDGKLLRGSIDRVLYNDEIFPVELTQATWKLLPAKLLSAAVGVNFSFKAYGGLGDGDFERLLNGDMNLRDVNFTGPAKGLEPLLPLPIATFSGQFAIQIELAELRNQLLSKLIARVGWTNAVLETPMQANLGNIVIDIAPLDEQTHRGVIQAGGGDLDVSGSIDLLKNGDFSSNVIIEPRSNASPDLLNALRGLGRADNQGRYRLQRKGNINRLM